MFEQLSLIVFVVFIIFMLVLDLGVFHKKDAEIKFKEALIWTLIWISLALIFYVLIYFKGELIHGIQNMDDLVRINKGHNHKLNFNGMTFTEALKLYRHTLSLEYLSGYLIEKALSLDNIFVFIMIFASFKVNRSYIHRILFFGILGALVFRFIFIFAASALIDRFAWILVFFGILLIYTAFKMFMERNEKKAIDTEKHKVVKFFAKRGWSTSHTHGHDFFIKENGRWLLTPLFIVLMIVELSDIVFALDSIPAIFAVTNDPYIVFMSNVFAILGLRSLFFMLESIMDKFRYLKLGLSVLLAYIGVKMIVVFFFKIHISTTFSLLMIALILAASILGSLLVDAIAKKKTNDERRKTNDERQMTKKS
jgi:tellurite resistance protein TerC